MVFGIYYRRFIDNVLFVILISGIAFTKKFFLLIDWILTVTVQLKNLKCHEKKIIEQRF